MWTSTPCVHDDRTFPNSQIALYWKLDLILAGNMEQAAAIVSLREENEGLKTELSKINKDVQHLAETSTQQSCSKPQTSKLPRYVCVSCLHTIYIIASYLSAAIICIACAITL